MIIAFNGDIGCGKSSACQYLQDYHGFIWNDLADPIRQICAIMFGVSVDALGDRTFKEKLHPDLLVSPRTFMRQFGTEFARETLGREIWLKILLKKIQTSHQSVDCCVSDLRFQNEADALTTMPECSIIHITRASNPFSVDTHHSSEDGIDPKYFNYSIENNSTEEDFHHRLSKMVRGISRFDCK